MKTKSEHPVVFFDGVCGLCNAFVDFTLSRDRRRIFRFSPLQGRLAQEVLEPTFTENLNTVILRDGGNVLMKSDAALSVLTRLGGLWKLAAIFKVVPKTIRDKVYDFVARHRYRWFGKKETCRIPSPSERTLFID